MKIDWENRLFMNRLWIGETVEVVPGDYNITIGYVLKKGQDKVLTISEKMLMELVEVNKVCQHCYFMYAIINKL